MTNPTRVLTMWPGVGLVAANMIGTGVFLSSGFMAQSMGPGPILLAWLCGTVLALCGAVAYAEVARLVVRSGGEYRYLSTLLHPALGYVAGWGSLLVGFSAPVAVDALAAGAFAQAVWPALDPRWVGIAVLVVLTAFHAFRLQVSATAQNLLIGVKVLILLLFVGVGVVKGSLSWPQWTTPGPTGGFPLEAWVGSLFYIAFAFSGWNAAIYASEEFAEPKRDVPRAMLVGCVLVATLYMVVNYIFVANLTPEQATIVFRYDSEHVTLGHAIMQKLVGVEASRVWSAAVVLIFVSAISAMTFVGPRVYAAMAEDGFLPKVLAAKQGRPPAASIVLQSALAAVIVFTHSLQQALSNVGAILTLFAALTVLGLFRARFGKLGLSRPSTLSLVAAAVYTCSAGYMLYFGFKGSTHLLWWIAGVVLVALVAYAATTAYRARGATAAR